jgi:protein-disulfide isomerase
MTLRIPVGPDDHAAGPPDAPLTLLEYGDYECPYCGRAFWQVRDLQMSLGDRLRFVFRNFPLSEIHPNALQAAEAAEAAGTQGHFWEMHETLFEHQDALDFESLLSYAEALGLDLRRFTVDLEEHRFLPKIRKDFLGGARSGVNGTPTFFVNGVRHEGALTMESVLATLRGTNGTETPLPFDS